MAKKTKEEKYREKLAAAEKKKAEMQKILDEAEKYKKEMIVDSFKTIQTELKKMDISAGDLLEIVRRKPDEVKRLAGEIKAATPADFSNAPKCDTCGAEMIVKTNKDGGKFWACPNWSSTSPDHKAKPYED